MWRSGAIALARTLPATATATATAATVAQVPVRAFSATSSALRSDGRGRRGGGRSYRELHERYIPASIAARIPPLDRIAPLVDDPEANLEVLKLARRGSPSDSSSATATATTADAKADPLSLTGGYEPQEIERFHAPPEEAEPPRIGGTFAWDESLGVPRDVFNSLTKRVLHVHRTVNMTRKGKIQSMYAMVVVGNGNGLAGYGEGKNTDLAKAVQKAVMAAVKNMVPIPRYDARTIQHDIEHKFKATQLQMWAKRPGFGVRANPHVHEICKCAGIHDVAAKVHRSRNPMNVVKATFEALLAQRTPEEIARARGRKLTDVYKTYYGVI